MTTAFVSRTEDCDIHPSGWLQIGPRRWISKRPIWDRAEDCPARIGVGPAREWAGRRGLRVAAAAEYEQLHQRALFIAPVTLPTVAMIEAAGVPRPWSDAQGRDTPQMARYRAEHMRTREWCRIHDDEVKRRLAAAGYDGTQAVANDGKHLDVDGDIIGWWKAAAPATAKIQNESAFHRSESAYTDYATNLHVCYDGDSPPASSASTDATPLPPLPPPVSRPGDTRETVRVWQQWLVDHGYKLPKYGVDGLQSPGGETDRATALALKEHPEWSSRSSPATTVDSYPLIRAKNFTPADRKVGDVYMITLHSIQCPPRAGFARSNAKAFASPSAKNASIHWWVDPAEVIQGLEEQHHAWGAKSGPERHAQAFAIHVEHAGFTRQPAYTTSSGKRVPEVPQTDWLGEGLPIVERSAKLTAVIIQRWDLLPERMTPERMAAWRDAIRRADRAAAWKLRGINMHLDWTKAYGIVGGHHDIGGWPWDEWLEMVRGRL